MPWGKAQQAKAACKAARELPARLYPTQVLAALQAACKLSPVYPGHQPSASALGWVLPTRWAGFCVRGSSAESFPELGERSVEVFGDFDRQSAEWMSGPLGLLRLERHQLDERLTATGDEDFLAGLSHLVHESRQLLAGLGNVERFHPNSRPLPVVDQRPDDRVLGTAGVA